MENILVNNPYECILIYIDNKPSASTISTNEKKFYNYGDYVTGNLCLVTDGNTSGDCSTVVVTGTPVANCQFYKSATKCKTCLPGFFVATSETACTACGTNCATCSTADACLTCQKVTDTPSSGQCTNAVGGTNCFTSFDNSGVTCRSCVNGAYFTSLTNGVCALQSAYDAKEPACHWSCGAQADLTPPGTYAGSFCTVTADAAKCSRCLPGSYVKRTNSGDSTDVGTCMTCGLNCLECSDETSVGATYGNPVCTKWDYQGYSAVITESKQFIFLPYIN